ERGSQKGKEGEEPQRARAHRAVPVLGDVAVKRGVPGEETLAELHRPAGALDVVDPEARKRQRPDDEHSCHGPRHHGGAQVAPDELPNRLAHRGGDRNRAKNSPYLSFAGATCRTPRPAAVSERWIASPRPSSPPRSCPAPTYQIVRSAARSTTVWANALVSTRSRRFL